MIPKDKKNKIYTKIKPGFGISCSVRRKLFEESTTTAGEFKRCNSNVMAYISVLKFLQVSVKSITQFKSVIALYKSVLFLSCHLVDSIDSISADPDPTDPI